jgi:zinc/manganese transport system ATP-binding protein
MEQLSVAPATTSTQTRASNEPQGRPEATGAPLIVVEDAEVRLRGRVIWRDARLTVYPGEFIAIVGPNGAGKSTLLRAILGLQPLSAGRITVLDRPARGGNVAIGYAPQRHHFESDIRIRGSDLVRLGLDGARWGLPLPGFLGGARAREASRQAWEIIELVGASAYADRPIGELSGGEQQRLLIAQALVTRPCLLALDEPLDSLDPRNQQAVAEVIRRASREVGAAVLLVTHDVNPVLSMLDRVVYVAGGQVAAGKPEEIITSATLTRLYGAPVEVLRASDGRVAVLGQSGATGSMQGGLHDHGA